MRISRRNFLRKSLKFSAASIAGSSLLFPKDISAEMIELNHKPDPLTWSDSSITVSWIGHSTVLINFYGTWILTDPVLHDRVGIYMFGTSFGPSRFTPPALTVEEIPKPDIILLSHAHMDHTDYPTLSDFTDMYPNEIHAVNAYLTRDVIRDLEWKSITMLDWGQSATVKDVNIKALEVKHFGWRFPWEKDRSRGFFKDGRSYNAYILEKNGKRLLFGGDTAFTDKFKTQIKDEIDIAIMPIGAYYPWKKSHCNPEEALIMADEINARYFVPIHCYTFKQGMEPIEEPLIWLNKAAPNFNAKVIINEIGQTFEL